MMFKNFFKLVFFFSYLINCNSEIFAQNKMWRSIDDDLNEEFARAFMDVVNKSDMELGDDDNIPFDNIEIKIELNQDNPENLPLIYVKIKNTNEAIDAFHIGPNGSLDQQILKKVDKTIIQKILKRKYEWDHLSNEEAKLHMYGTRTAFKVADYKEVRDYFWWTRLKFKLNPLTNNNEATWRPGGAGPWSISIKQGYEDIGFPGKLSNDSRIFFGTEPTKIFLNIPWTAQNIGIGKVHPLEGASGGGLAFNVDKIGGIISHNTLKNLEFEDTFDPSHSVFNDWSGLIYWTMAFKVTPRKTPEISKNEESPKPVIPAGTQRLLAGVGYAKLTYGYVDTLSGFNKLESTDFGESFSIYVKLQYISDKIDPKDSGYNYFYNKWVSHFQVHFGNKLRLNLGLLRSFSPFVAAGFNVAWVQSVTFLEGTVNEYTWDPGLVLSPNITFRW